MTKEHQQQNYAINMFITGGFFPWRVERKDTNPWKKSLGSETLTERQIYELDDRDQNSSGFNHKFMREINVFFSVSAHQNWP